MTLETLQAVKFGGSKGSPKGERSELRQQLVPRGSRKQGAGRALEDGSGKGGEAKASREERAGNIDPTAVTVNHSKARRTRQVVDTGLALRVSLSGETALSRSFGRSLSGLTSNSALILPVRFFIFCKGFPPPKNPNWAANIPPSFLLFPPFFYPFF